MRGSIVTLGLALVACSHAGGADADTEVATGSGEPTFTGGDGSDASSAGHATSTAEGTTTAGGDDSSSGDPPSGPPTLTRVEETFEIATLAASMPKRFVDAAHDPAADVYLVVNGNAAVSGAFIDADGAPLAEPFAIAETDAWTQGVRVARGDGFLVACGTGGAVAVASGGPPSERERQPASAGSMSSSSSSSAVSSPVARSR